MALLVTDPWLEERLKTERKDLGADRFDEVWEGVYIMTPFPDDEHQQIVLGLAAVLQELVGWPGLGQVRAGVNLTDRETDWQFNYRVPDVALFLAGGRAENHGTYWRVAADFLAEITSPDDRVREKLPFYSRLGVRELLLVDRPSWTLELYRWQEGELRLAGQSRASAGDVLRSEVVPLQFQLVPADPRPRIEVTASETGRRWSV